MLSVFRDGVLAVVLRGSWLYPLFVLGYVLADRRGEAALGDLRSIRLIDSRVGQGAVFLYASMGITTVHGGLVSALAAEKATHFGLSLTADEVVSRLDCRTEELLHDVTSLDDGVHILHSRLTSSFTRRPGSAVSLECVDDPHLERVVSSVLGDR